MRLLRFTLVLVTGLLPAFASAGETSMATVGPAEFKPLYAPSRTQDTVQIAAFRLDRRPVTNGEFLAFVRQHPEWQRHRVLRLFADDAYLTHWFTPTALGPGVDARQPVTRVSWFAAKAYCEALHKRLPTENEWELAAAASDTAWDARIDPARQQAILAWYGRPTSRLGFAGLGRPNLWGVRDLHELVWEWVLDFNDTLLSTDSRDGADPSKTRFCGEGALSTREREDYASFMRTAFRSSLEARYTTRNLGFRCAADLPEAR